MKLQNFLLGSEIPLLAAGIALLALNGSAAAQNPTQGADRGLYPSPDATTRTPFERDHFSAQDIQALSRAEQRSHTGLTAAPTPLQVAEEQRRSNTPPASVGAAALLPLTEVHVGQVEDGGFHVRGRSYKASFGIDGAVFIPFLGSDAPRNFPLSMQLVEAHIGSDSLGLEPARVERLDDRIAIDRGPVRVEYVPGLEALEQLFVLDRPSGNAGDLNLVLAVETELESRPQGAGWAFEGPRGGVHYGEVIAIDAAGQRLAMPARVDRDRIELTVPATFLANASYPIAVDPLISTSTIEGSDAQQGVPDIAWDPVLDRFTVVFEETFSASDRDVKLLQTSLNGSVVAVQYLDLSVVDTREPRVAVNQFSRRALVVYTTGSIGDRDIQGNLITLNSVPGVGIRTLISDNPEGLDLSSPDVGGDAFDEATNAFFTIVWQRIWNDSDSDIVMRQLTPGGLLFAEQLITNFGGVRDEAPSISSCIPSGEIVHNLVWRRHLASNVGVVAAQYFFNGFEFTPPFNVESYTGDTSLSEPSVSALGPNVPGEDASAYAIAYSMYDPYTIESDVLLFVFAGSNLIATALDSFIEHTERLDDQLRPSIATSGTSFAVAYEGGTDFLSAHATHITSFNMANREIAVRERRVVADAGTGDHFNPRICSTWEFGDGGPAYGPFGVTSRHVGSTGSDIVFGRYQGGLASGAQYQACHGNPNSTGERSLLTIDGYAGDTTTARVVRVEGLPTHKWGMFFASRSTFVSGIVPFNSSGRLCLRNPIGRFPGLVNSGAAGHVQIVANPTALPEQGNSYPALPGTTWYFQFWHRDQVSGAATSNFSNAAGIPFH